MKFNTDDGGIFRFFPVTPRLWPAVTSGAGPLG